MRFDLVESVCFGELRKDRHDRKGCIATFYLKPIPNNELAFEEAVAIAQAISIFLSSYHERDTLARGQTGEQNQCWISSRILTVGPAVRLDHKYWSDSQIEAFKDIVRILAKLHKWKVIE